MTDTTTPPTTTERDNAVRWWRDLAENPAALAQLRRAHSGLEAALTAEALRLARMLGAQRSTEASRFAHACELARVLAWVKASDTQPLIRRLGWPQFPTEQAVASARPQLSEARFRRLLRTDDPTELADAMIRLVRQAGYECAVGPLARDFLDWLTPHRAERTKQRWAYDYFHAGFAAPTPTDTEDADA